MEIKKVTINLPEDLIDFLNETALKEHKNFTEILRRAIRNERFFSEQESMGRKIIILDELGKLWLVTEGMKCE